MHDPRFKRLLKEFFPEFFSLFFPGWAERFDFAKIEWLDKEIVTDALEGESRTVDIVAKLPTLDAEQYVRQENWLGVALAALMQMTKERRISLAAEALERLVHCPENSYRKTLLCECVSAYLPLDEEQRQQYEDMLRNHPDSGVQAMQLGFLDHIEQRGIELGIRKGIEQGIEKGIEQGIEKGKLEGLRGLLREQLEARFGPLSPSAIARLEASSSDELKEFGVALISASSLAQLGLGDAAAD